MIEKQLTHHNEKVNKMSNKIDELIKLISDYQKKDDEITRTILKNVEILERGSAILHDFEIYRKLV